MWFMTVVVFTTRRAEMSAMDSPAKNAATVSAAAVPVRGLGVRVGRFPAEVEDEEGDEDKAGAAST